MNMTTNPAGKTLTLKVNGEAKQVLEAASVAALLAGLGYRDAFVAVAVNRAVVPRRCYATTPVRDGDEVEILAPMAGG